SSSRCSATAGACRAHVTRSMIATDRKRVLRTAPRNLTGSEVRQRWYLGPAPIACPGFWKNRRRRPFAGRIVILTIAASCGTKLQHRSMSDRARAMPRYYFHLMSATQTCDCGFLDMSDDEAAREEAELEGYDVLDDHAGGDWSNWTVRVTDE